VAEATEAFPFDESLTFTLKVTLKFTSDTQGEAKAEITKYDPDPGEEMKSKMKESMAEDNGAFTSTYTADAKTGTYTLKSGTTGTFIVDVAKKELTTTQVDDDGETETSVLKLQ
jgi:hypothetical protein